MPPPGRGSTRKGSGKGKNTRGGSKGGRGRGRSKRRSAPQTDPIMIFIGWVARAVSGVWMLFAHAAGAGARALGRSARDLDPLHRRDGVGLAFLGAAIVVAATTWWHLGNASRIMTELVHGAFGSLAWLVPVLLALLAWRFLRHPDRNAETGRLTIGGSALLIGALGLLHIAHGTPTPADGSAAMRAAGGFIGYAVSAPLVAVVTPWVAAPLLALLCAFGLLVITGTPLHRVPDRLAELRGGPGAGRPMDRTARPGPASARPPGSGASGRPRSRPASTASRTTRRCCGRGRGRRGGRWRDRGADRSRRRRLQAGRRRPTPMAAAQRRRPGQTTRTGCWMCWGSARPPPGASPRPAPPRCTAAPSSSP